MTIHRIRIEVDGNDEAYSWECDCGVAGSSGSGGFLKADLHSDKHIPADDSRIDVYPAH